MKSFLVNKTLPFYCLPVVNFDTGFLFLGNALFVRDCILNKVIYSWHHLRGDWKENRKKDLYIDRLLSQNITKRRAKRCVPH